MTIPTTIPTTFSEPAYGTSTKAERAQWHDALSALLDSGIEGNKVIRDEVMRMEGAACNYATGWYDAIRGGLSHEDRARMFEMIWPFSQEVGRAYYLFLTGRISARYGHGLAWEKALKTLKPEGNDALG